MNELLSAEPETVWEHIAPHLDEALGELNEGDRDAVQIMTMHRAKGLEADYVFVYGGFGPAPNDKVRTFVVDGRRRRLAGRPRLPATTDLIRIDRDGEDQRLYYVALTRARKRLYLPYSGKVPEGDASLFEAAKRFRDENTVTAKTLAELEAHFADKRGFVAMPWDDDLELEARIKERTGATLRCMPLEASRWEGLGRSGQQIALFAKAY